MITPKSSLRKSLSTFVLISCDNRGNFRLSSEPRFWKREEVRGCTCSTRFSDLARRLSHCSAHWYSTQRHGNGGQTENVGRKHERAAWLATINAALSVPSGRAGCFPPALPFHFIMFSLPRALYSRNQRICSTHPGRSSCFNMLSDNC